MVDYKQTDVGLIPNDWEVVNLENIGNFKNGINKSKEDFGFGSPFVNLLDVFGIPHISSNKKLDLVNSNSEEKKLYNLVEGDVIFVRSSVKPSGVGLTTVVKSDLKDTVFSGFLIRFRININFSNEYKIHCFHSKSFRTRLIASSSFSANTNINQDALKKLQIPLPPLPEQEAIAEVLSDTDALIGALEKRIAKKRLIKQGAMQTLLTPPARRGGKDDWEVKKIKDIVSTPVTDGPHLTPKFQTTGIPFLSVNNLVDNKVDLSDLRYISKEDDKIFSMKCKPQKGDLLFGKAASVGKIAIVEEDIDFNIWSPIALIRLNKENDPKFVYYFFQTNKVLVQISYFTNASSQGNVGMGDIEKIELALPTITEQTRIATILSDMDNEIDALEKKLSKTKELKQGLMQQLLTGKIRLV